MRITNIEVFDLKVPLKTPFKTALRTVNFIEDIIVKIETDIGLKGFGEAAPTLVITGETYESIKYTIMHVIKPILTGVHIENFEEMMERLHRCIVGNTSAKAAVDMALYDLRSQFYQTPLYKLLGGYRSKLETDITISLNPVETMIHDSLEAVKQGYRILKVKVGREPDVDINRIKEIRKEVGNQIRIRVDANQGWTAKEAIYIIRKLEDLNLDIELVEQPVKSHDILGLKEVTKSTYTKILADESVFSPRDAMIIIQERAADCINIKLMKTGGIHKALQICAIAEVNEIECMIGCMLESKVSVSAAAHLACGLRNITMVDLDGPALCEFDPIDGGPKFKGSTIEMIDKEGLGFQKNSFL